MSTSPLSPQEIRAAAAAHKELGPEYSDAVIESFLERVDREITVRVDARLGPVSREQPVQPAQSNGRRTLLTGVAIGIFITGVPSMMVAASAGGVIAKDEAQVLFHRRHPLGDSRGHSSVRLPGQLLPPQGTQHSPDRKPGPLGLRPA